MKKLKLFLAVILLINIFIVIFALSACKPKDDGDDNKIIPPPIDGIVEPYKFVGRDYYTQIKDFEKHSANFQKRLCKERRIRT